MKNYIVTVFLILLLIPFIIILVKYKESKVFFLPERHPSTYSTMDKDTTNNVFLKYPESRKDYLNILMHEKKEENERHMRDDEDRRDVFIILFIMFVILLFISILFWYYKLSTKEIMNKYPNKDKVKDNDKVSDSINKDYIQETLCDLDKNILKYNIIGIIALVFSTLCLIIMAVLIFHLFENTINDINEFKDEKFALAVMLILIRTSLLGSFVITFLVYTIRFAKASFDQSVRFNKRKHATMFLIDLSDSFGGPNKENLKDLMAAFKEWNVSIDSAYTDNRSGFLRRTIPKNEK